MGEAGGNGLKGSLDDQFFDLACRVLNYAIEFVNAPGYASLRLVDVLKGLLELQPQIEGVSRGEFYEKVRERLESRELLRSAEDRSKFLDELLTMFVDEWRNTSLR